MPDNRVSEPKVRHEILRLMSDGKVWTNQDLKRRLSNVLPLSNEDRARANERPNEEKWEEIVNNALSKSRSKSLTALRFVETVTRGEHQITQTGLEELVILDLWERDPRAARDLIEERKGREIQEALEALERSKDKSF